MSALLAQVRKRLGLSLGKELDQRLARLYLFTSSGNQLGQVTMRWGRFFYRIDSIQVSQPNQGKGLGRLLQMEAAALAVQRGLYYRFPALAFTHEGARAFQEYPLQAERLIEEKIQLDLDPKIKDVPWKEPQVTPYYFSGRWR